MADIVPLDTPLAAVPVSIPDPPVTPPSGAAPAPPRKPLPAKTIRMSPASETAPTVAAPLIDSILARGDAKPAAPSEVVDLFASPPESLAAPAPLSVAEPVAADAMGFTAPMSAPPKSAVTPLPALAEPTVMAVADATVMAVDSPVTALAPSPTELAPVPDSGSAPPTRPSVRAAPMPASAAVSAPDPLRARFELVDRYTRPYRVWILLGLAAAVTIAETFDSLIGSFPIFRTLAAAMAWIGAFTLLAARIAGAHDDDAPWSFDAAIVELRAAAESAVRDVQLLQTASTTHKKRLVGRGLFLLGLVGFALWSIIDAARLVFSEIFHVAMRERPDVSGHATLAPFVFLSAGAVVLYLVARDEQAGELKASKEVLAQAMPLHATPMSQKQLIEQARLFPTEYHAVLAAIAAPSILGTERQTARGLRDNLLRTLDKIEASADVAAKGHETTSRRAQLSVGKSVLVDVTFARTEADVERAAKRARSLADEKRGGLIVAIAIAKGPSELKDLLTPKIADVRKSTPTIAVWIEAP